MSVFLPTILALLGLATSAPCVIPSRIEEGWGYVDIRPAAHMFWWFMKTPCEGADTKPIIIWLQGGPGGSGTGYGNFMEIGPIDNNQQPRNYTWLKEASLLFIDSPVGAGFSYVDEGDAYTSKVNDVADDLVSTLQEISTVLRTKHYNGSALPPIFVFGESYGGKVAPVFGSKIVEVQEQGFLQDVILGGVAIGDGAVSLVDSCRMYPDYLFHASLIDYSQHLRMKDAVKEVEKHYVAGDFFNATISHMVLLEMIRNMTDDVFVYNTIYHNQPLFSLTALHHPHFKIQDIRGYVNRISHMSNAERMEYMKHLTKTSDPVHKLAIDYYGENVNKLMNEQMRKKFGVIPDAVKWAGQADNCMKHLVFEMIRDVIDSVDDCLDKGVRVIVYNGMLDLLVNSAGQEMWIHKLKWRGLKDYFIAERKPLYPPSLAKEQRTGAFHKAYKNFEYYWMLMSGHMVPIDAPEMSLEMVRRILNNEQ